MPDEPMMPDPAAMLTAALDQMGKVIAPLLAAAADYREKAVAAGFPAEVAAKMGGDYHALIAGVLVTSLAKGLQR